MAMKIREVMARDVWTCRPDESTVHAARIMWEHDCGVVPVLDEWNRPIGMITDRDVCMAAYTTGRALALIRVGDVMSRNVEVCRPEDSLLDAERAMQRRHVRRLPVVDEHGGLVGLLSLNDIARHVSTVGRSSAADTDPESVAKTLSSVCEPWPAIQARLAEHPESAAPARDALIPVLTS